MDGDQRDLRPEGRPDARPDAAASTRDDAPPPAPPKRRSRLPFLIAFVLVAAAAAGGVLWWLDARHYESTDDAFVDGHIAQVSAQIAGRVVRLAVADNQVVAQGDVLVEIDPRDAQVRLDQARAQQANAAAQAEQARAQVALQQASIDQAQSNAAVAEADLQQARQDLARYRAVNPQAITRQQLDTSTSTAKGMEARLEAARHAVAAQRAQLQAAEATVAAMDASARQAAANVAAAELQLSYVHVVAPQAGRVTRRTVEVGNYVNVGQAMLAVVPAEVWVTANFKETQLGRMRAGQAVDVALDAFPDAKVRGRVDSFQAGTGSAFSSLPAENATGNYVKVVQRVPVKVTLDPGTTRGLMLAPGMSVVPRVRVD